MIGAIVGGALGLASSVFGGLASRDAAEKARKNVEKQQRANQSWYDRRYNEDATQKADAVRALTITADNIRKRNKAAEGAAAVMGGGEEAVAATKEANNEALAEATSRIAAAGEARKDEIEQKYLENKQALENQESALEMQKAQNIAQAIQGAGQAAGSLAGGLDGLFAQQAPVQQQQLSNYRPNFVPSHVKPI